MSTETAETSYRSAALATPDAAGALGDTLLLRINPVPGRRLGTPELRAALRTLIDAQVCKQRLSEAACDQLYALAAQLTGKQRHLALSLKRAIYNDRDPGAAADGFAWPEAVDAWLAAQHTARQAQAGVRSGHAAFLAAERLALAETVGDESLHRGLALNAPEALDAVHRYIRRSAQAAGAERKSERGIVQYLTRAMVRTSPLSWFTAVGFAVWSADGTPFDAPVFDRRAARSFVTVDRVLFGATVTGMIGPAAGAPVLALNATLRPAGSTVRFQRRTGASVHLVETPLTAQLRALLEITALGPLPAAVLAEQLARRLGVDPGLGAEVVTAAAKVQILVPGPVLDEQAADPLPQARAALGPDHPGTALVTAVQREMAEVATGSVARRRAALGRLQVVQDRINALTERPARLHLNEDVMLPTTTVTDRGYQAALHDLAGVVELAAAFDPHQVLRCLLTTVFTERFGAGGSVNLVDCAADLAREVADRAKGLTPANAGERKSAGGELARLLAVRDRARGELAAEVEAGRGQEEVWLPAGIFRELAASLPDRLRDRPASYGVLVQPAEGRLVVNGLYGGHNLLGMRFLGPAASMDTPSTLASLTYAPSTQMPSTHAPEPIGGPETVSIHERVSRRVVRLFGDDGVRLLEDHGMHGSNINHRTRLLPEVIDPVGWLGLRLTHDPDTDELALLDGDGRPVRPLYFGMRWIETLPAPLRIAMWLSDTSQVAFDPVGWARRIAVRAAGPVPTTTSRYPRVVVGTAVIARQRWYPGSDFPPDTPDEADRLPAITRWRAAHGVPEEIVLKTVPEPRAEIDPAAALAWYQRARRPSKPQYVDLASALMVRVLPRLLARRGSGFVEEALPGVRDGRHAFEWVVEYDRPAGGRFHAGRPPRPCPPTVEKRPS